MEQTLKQLIFQNSFAAIYDCLNQIAEDTRHDLEKISLPLAPKKKPEKLLVQFPETIEFCNEPVPKAIVPATFQASSMVQVQLPKTIEFCNEPVPKAPAPTNKEIHKKAVSAKAETLKNAGIQPGSLLTKEALTKWINDGKTYWYIAEETGASDAEVSAMAKAFGLQSTLSKIVAGKKKNAF
jgi:hypothetical protein